MSDAQRQKKTIIPTSLNFKDIKPSFGKTFKPFSVYEITGNDGVKYETLDKAYYSTFQIGISVEIEYEVISRPSNGRVFTSYKLVGPVRVNPDSQRILDRIFQAESTVLSEIRRAEKNILKAIELHSKGVKTEIEEEEEDLSEAISMDDLENEKK